MASPGRADENRVALLPVGAETFIRAGHRVLVKTEVGAPSGSTDEDYRSAGTKIVSGPEEVYGEAEMVVKMKEPLEPEYGLLRQGQILFCYFHFAASLELTVAIQDSGTTTIAYEMVQLANSQLPLLIPMREVAGRMAVQEGAKYLESPLGGRGILLAGVPGVSPADVVVLVGCRRAERR